VSSVILRKLRSARYRAGVAIDRCREASLEARKRRVYAAWIRRLTSHPPDVLIGANFAEYGGVREHIRSIARYSSLRVELAPPDDILALVNPHEVKATFKAVFDSYSPRGVKAVHSHVFPWFVEWCNALPASRPRWIHTYHLPYVGDHSGAELLPWQREFNDVLLNVARNADVTISVSKWQQRELREQHGIEAAYIPNGVDVLLCDEAEPERFRERFEKNAFVLYVGRNDPVKNPLEFVRLASALPSLRFVMIGRGLTRDSLAAALGAAVPANLVVFDELPHRDVADAIAASSAVVVTSRREGLPTLVLEAMALAKPTVVSNEPGSLEAVDGGAYGFAYELGSIDDLVRQTRAALGDTTMGPRARQRVLDEYDWRVVAPQLDRIYTSAQ
jgi:glycosyltransferase involved in cell wall biosynthesis